MKIAVVAKNTYDAVPLKDKLKEFGCHYVSDNPDVVVSWGGDGTFLIAEQKFQGIPKVLVRDSRLCLKCNVEDIHDLAVKMQFRKFKYTSFRKLELSYLHKKLLASNDIILRNKNQQQAIRFDLYRNGRKIYNQEFIGDGLVFATVFGSTAYYNSITRKTIKSGAAIAFNNTVEPHQPFQFRKSDIIKVVLTRGPAILTVDNIRKSFILNRADTFTVRISDQKAKIVRFH
ncbi:hypothetical protein JW868_01065 [Candidatus Woesearchaeota archaeon]|nr:hypothetical protein [Candidatus Woesearchaeota archaeon]